MILAGLPRSHQLVETHRVGIGEDAEALATGFTCPVSGVLEEAAPYSFSHGFGVHSQMLYPDLGRRGRQGAEAADQGPRNGWHYVGHYAGTHSAGTSGGALRAPLRWGLHRLCVLTKSAILSKVKSLLRFLLLRSARGGMSWPLHIP